MLSTVNQIFFKIGGSASVFVLLILSIFGYSDAQAVDFIAKGDSSIESFMPNGSLHKRFPGHFTICKTGDKWAIQYAFIGSPTSEETVFDGADTFTLTRNIIVDTNMAAQHANDVQIRNGVAYAKTSTAIIFSGEYPHGAASIPRLLWLGILHNFKGDKSMIMPAPWLSSFEPQSGAFEIETRFQENSKSDNVFPQQIRFLASEHLWTNALHKLPSTMPLSMAFPFTNGFMGGIYTVTDWTNNDGKIDFPSKIKLERFYPSRDKKTSFCIERYICEIKSVQLEKVSISAPQLLEDTSIIDYRFQSEVNLPWFYVVYPVQDKKWRATNDPEVRGLINVYLTNYTIAHSLPQYARKLPLPIRTSKQRIIIISVLAITTFIPLLLIFKKQFGQKINKY